MDKLIAVWGSPASGKTVTAAKLAVAIANKGKNTILISHSTITPSIPVMFPTRLKEFEGLSLGKVLDRPDIVQSDILAQGVVYSKSLPLTMLGYNIGENIKTYPDFQQSKHVELILQASQLADYVVVDCTSDTLNKTTLAALQQADVILQLYKPEVRSEVFFSSHKSIVENSYLRYENMTSVMRTGINTKMQAVNDVSSAAHVEFIIPFSMGVAAQYESGQLFDNLNDSAYNRAISKLVHHIMDEGGKADVITEKKHRTSRRKSADEK